MIPVTLTGVNHRPSTKLSSR